MKKQTTLQFKLSDFIYILVSFLLLGVGCAIMLLAGFDVWFAYLMALPALLSFGSIHSALRRESNENSGDETRDVVGSSH